MKPVKTIMRQNKMDKFEKGEIEIVGADEISRDGFLQLPRTLARKNHFTPAAKVVFAGIVGYAWAGKDSSFPGQEKLAEDLGLSVKTIYNSLRQLQGYNDEKEVYFQVVHRGHGLTNLYRIFFKMDSKKLEYVSKQVESKIGKNYRSKLKKREKS
jgi:hypothetical protein